MLIWGIEFRNRNERKSWKVRNVVGACYRSSASKGDRNLILSQVISNVFVWHRISDK